MAHKSVPEYLRFQRWVLVAIVVVWGARLGLSLAGLPGARLASVTWLLVAGALTDGVAVHARDFGGYKQLYVLNLFQSLLAETLVALGIVVAILTGQHNIFTVPDFVQGFVQGQDGRSFAHALAHIAIPGAIVLPLAGWLVSSIVMFLTRRVAPRKA